MCQWQTWTPTVVDSPHLVIGNLDERSQYTQLRWLDVPEDGFGVGACLDTDDRGELFATRRLILPCKEPPGRPREVTRFALSER